MEDFQEICTAVESNRASLFFLHCRFPLIEVLWNYLLFHTQRHPFIKIILLRSTPWPMDFLLPFEKYPYKFLSKEILERIHLEFCPGKENFIAYILSLLCESSKASNGPKELCLSTSLESKSALFTHIFIDIDSWNEGLWLNERSFLLVVNLMIEILQIKKCIKFFILSSRFDTASFIIPSGLNFHLPARQDLQIGSLFYNYH